MSAVVDRSFGPCDDGAKSRGAFFTPPAICDFIAGWAIRSSTDRVLEPSCGDAAFLTSVAQRLGPAGAGSASQLIGFDQVQGVELHEPSAMSAAAAIARLARPSTIMVGDFFDLSPDPTFNAVVGNPPFIRYQDFAGASRVKAQKRALTHGVRLTGLASSWAAFVVHAAQFLAPGGRLGLVLPAELLSVNYASTVRSFLLRRFASVRLIMFEERVFPGVSEEVVLLLAEGDGPTDQFTVRQIRDASELAQLDGVSTSWRPRATDDKWLPALLPADTTKVYGDLLSDAFVHLSIWGDPYLGAVTGNNRYFALTIDEVRTLGLMEKRDVIPVSPPGSKHLRGLELTDAAWHTLGAASERTWLFYPHEPLSDAARSYIAQGQVDGVPEAYKCKMRSPWWRVPIVPKPDLFLTYMNHDSPRLVSNRAALVHLNSIHGVCLKPGFKRLGMELLPIAMLNSMSMLGAELVGRSYGGGMLKIEPKEAGRMPVPSKALLEKAAPELRALIPQLGQALRGGDLSKAVSLVDRVLLVDGAQLKRPDVANLREGREAMFSRRAARA